MCLLSTPQTRTQSRGSYPLLFLYSRLFFKNTTIEYRSAFKIDIPVSDIPTFIFSGSSEESRKSPQYFDAENPSRNYNLSQAESLVKRVGKGFQDLSLSQGDRVLLYAGNNLHFPVLLWGTITGGFIFTGCSPSASVQGRYKNSHHTRNPD